MKKVHFIFIGFVLFLAACSTVKEMDTRWGRDNGIGAKLEGKTVVYTIFIDSKNSLFWNGFDIASAKDSLNRSFAWIQEQAEVNGQSLEIIPEYYKAGSKQTFKKKLPYDKVSDAFAKDAMKDMSKLDKWAEGIVKRAEKTVKLPKGVKLPAKPRLKGFDKFVAKLKLKHGAENVAVFFMLNNYFMVDASAVMNSMSTEGTEYAINSGKNTNLLTSQLLCLFGAQFLNTSENSRYKIKNIEMAEQDFPNDVMVNDQSDIQHLEIGAFTAFMLGWSESADSKYKDFFRVKLRKNEKKKF